MDGVWAQRESGDALVQLAHRNSRVISHFRNLLDELAVAAGDPADAQASEGVGFAEGPGGDGVCVAGGEEGGWEVVVQRGDGVEEGPVDFVAEDGDGFGFGVVCEGVEEGFGEDGAGGVLGVAGKFVSYESETGWGG